MKTIALSIWMAVVTGCGSKTLDAGGTAGSGGSTGGGGLLDAPTGPGVTNSTPIVTHQRNAASLYSEGAYLYWSTYDEAGGDGAYEILRCNKRDCAATRQSLFRTKARANLIIHGGRAYFGHGGGIVSCPVEDCSNPKVVISPTTGSPSFVDDVNVYWGGYQDNAILSCPLSGCDKASAAVTGTGTVLALKADTTHLYWTIFDPSSAGGDYSNQSAPKDGSGAPTTLIRGLTKPTSLAVSDGFVYWAEMLAKGSVARCSASGGSSGAETLAPAQFYPRQLVLDRGVLFWLTEVSGADLSKVERPAKVMSCLLSSCATTIEVLDQAQGGSTYDPTRALYNGSLLVVDEEAIYYLGDMNNGGLPASQSMMADASIRRLPRPPGR